MQAAPQRAQPAAAPAAPLPRVAAPMNLLPAALPMGPAPGSFRAAQEEALLTGLALANINNYGNPYGPPGASGSGGSGYEGWSGFTGYNNSPYNSGRTDTGLRGEYNSSPTGVRSGK